MAIGEPQSSRPKKVRWTARGTLGLIAFAVFLVYIAVPIVLHATPLYKSIVLVPTPWHQAAYDGMDGVVGRAHEEYWIANANSPALHAYFWRVPHARKVIVYHHGNAGDLSNRSASCAALVSAGASVFIYDYEGFGKSKGKASLEAIMQDGLTAFDFVNKQLGFDPKDILNYGESLGSAAACRVAADRTCGGLILQSAIPSLPKTGQDHFAFLKPYPDFAFPSPTMNNLQLVQSIHCPIAIIHGMKDPTVYPENAKLMYERAGSTDKTLTLLQDSGHNSVASKRDLNVYFQAIRRIINGTTNGAPAAS